MAIATPSDATKVSDLLRIGHRFTCFQEVEKLVLDLRRLGFPVRMVSSCLVGSCNQVEFKPSLYEKWKYSFIRFVCDQQLTATNCSFSFEINYIDRLCRLMLTQVNLHHNSVGSFISHQNEKLKLISNLLHVIRSKTGDVLVFHVLYVLYLKLISLHQALYRQSDAQRKLYDRHGDVLVINLHYVCPFKSKKTLLAISVIDNDDGRDYSVCLVTLPECLSLKMIACCFKIFTSFNDPSSVKSVVVNREELLPNVGRAFPEADLLVSKGRMLQKVSNELSKHKLKLELREKLLANFVICCSTSCEHEFGHAEDYLLSADGRLGSYFKTWFEQTEIWRAIDNLRRLKKDVDLEKVISNINRKLAQTGFFNR